MFEQVVATPELAGAVAGIDTGAEEPAEESAGTDIGSEELAGEAELLRICHRTGRNHQAVDHTICKASSSRLFEIRLGLNLLCFCPCHEKPERAAAKHGRPNQ